MDVSLGGCLTARETVYTSLSYPVLLFDWFITLTLIVFDNMILDQSAGSESGVDVDFYAYSRCFETALKRCFVCVITLHHLQCELFLTKNKALTNCMEPAGRCS